jgi:hypothetical protein
MPANYVQVRIQCRSRSQILDLCVPVNRQVPEPLRCTPGNPVGGGARLPLCREGEALLAPGRLIEVVDRLTSRGWGEYVRLGYVLVECG